MEENILIRQCIEGSPEACRTLFDRYVGLVRGVARRMLHDEHEADDVAQEVFERVFQNLTRFRGDSSLATWLRRIVVNRCLNRLGQRGRLVPLDQVEGELRAADDRPGERERASDLSAGLARLEPAERALVVLASQEGSSYEELGRAFKANRDEIRGRLYRARRKLKELLGW